MSKGRTSSKEAVAISRGQYWMIKWDGCEYLVCFYSRRNNGFSVLCSCEFYDQADVICKSMRCAIPDPRILEYCEGGFYLQ